MRKLLQFLHLRYDRPGSLLDVLKETLEQGSYSSVAIKASGERGVSPEYFEYLVELFKIESETVVGNGHELLKDAPVLQRSTFLAHSNWADGVSMHATAETLANFGKLFAAPKPKYITGIDEKGNSYRFKSETPEDPRCAAHEEYRNLTHWLKPGNEPAAKLVVELLKGTPVSQIIVGVPADEIDFSWLKVLELAKDCGCASYDDWVRLLGRAEDYFTYHLQDIHGLVNLCQAVVREACKDRGSAANALAAVQHLTGAKYKHFLMMRTPYEMFDTGDVPVNGPALVSAYSPYWGVVQKLAPNYAKFGYASQDDFLRQLFNEPVANLWRITNGDAVDLSSEDAWVALDYLKVDQEKWHQKTVDFWVTLMDLMLAERQSGDHGNLHIGNLLATAEAAVQ